MASGRFSIVRRWTARLLLPALFVLCAVLLGRRETWRPLPGGGEVRLLTVEYSETLDISRRGIEMDGLRDWLGPTFSRLLGPYPTSDSARFDRPTLVAAFASRGRDGKLLFQKARCEIDLPGGQTLLGHSFGGGGSEGRVMEPVTFRIVPFSERRLKMRVEVNGETLRFEVRNPALTQKAARWKAEPLPQTRTVEDVAITLDRVVGEWTDDPFTGSSWAARAEFSVGIDGQGAGDWVDCAPTISDPLGNESQTAALFSEPVWKVHCNAWKNERYPYPDSEVHWLGPVALPQPGEARVVTPTPDLLAVVGRGHYRVAAGEVTPIPAPVNAAADTPIRFFHPYSPGNSDGGEYVEIDVTSVAILSMAGPHGLGQGNRSSSHILMRNDSGQRLLLKRAHTVAETSLLVTPLAPGTREVEIGLATVRVLATEFFIPAPLPPAAQVKGKAGRD